MTKQDILHEVVTSQWQPEFKFTNNLNEVTDSILKPHEDYFLGFHDKVKEIIDREIFYAITADNYKITFADVCNWQKELFGHKIEKIAEAKKILFMYEHKQFPNFSENHQTIIDCRKANNLPNQHINLGLRQTNVKIGRWIPPAPMFLEELKGMCFPISDLEYDCMSEINTAHIVSLDSTYTSLHSEIVKYKLTQWYKTFQTIEYMEDFNYICGNIVVNVISYILTNKYIIYGRDLESCTFKRV